ncbi:SdpI family protein [Methanocorpusculum parvum]|uniref:DUF1648 domain-containing protein n=1 Tax=Methanocorpusculum parvum TaxID=2193 RepID=A0AAX0Q7P2_9EURY|nr:DUF1648 domain-containing protein [Methanocorpusculum parvum]PAV09266.1 hypothetical protein ASJ83_08375 [Methanocorpusculum parvum]
MKIDKTLFITSALCLAPILLGVLLYDRLPDMIPIHFDFAGDPDNWGAKPFVVFGMPALLCLLNIVCNVSTRKYGGENQSMLLKFARWLIAVIALIVVPITLFKAIGADIPIEVIVPVLVGVIFIIIGNYLPKTKQNPVAGVRVKWTMESAENWRRTSRFSGYLFIIGGFVMILNAFLALFWIPVFFGILIAMIAGPILYSYHLHKKGI